MIIASKLHHCALVVALVCGLSIHAAAGQPEPWNQVPICPTFAEVTSQPPAQCQPLISPRQLLLPKPRFVPVPTSCFPPAVGVPLKRPEPSLNVGYLFKNHGFQMSVDFDGPGEMILGATSTAIDLQGIWIEGNLPIVLTHTQDFVLSVGHLVPFASTTEQYYSLVNTLPAKREWSPAMQWWEVNTKWTYRLNHMSSGIVGFRWAQLVVDFNRARNQQGFTGSGDGAKLTANAYIPFVGLLLENSSPQIGRVSLSVIGFPFLPGDFEYCETLSLTGQPVWTKFAPGGEYKTGYFLEASGECSVRKGQWNFGAFGRFTTMHVERQRHLHVNGVLNQAEISFDRRNWIFGGTIGFSL